MLPITLESIRHSSARNSRTRFWLYLTAGCYLVLIMLAPSLTSGKVHDGPVQSQLGSPGASSTVIPEFRVAIALGDQVFVLHELAIAADAGRTHELEVLPLVHGQALLLTKVGEAQHPVYTLAFETRTCSTESIRRVRLELDSGEPEAPSALGPAWLADEVHRCDPAPVSPAPFVAVVGHERVRVVSAATTLPQRVIQGSRAQGSVPGGLGADEFLDATLELGQSSFAVLRSFRDLDRVRIISLDWRRHVALDARASLFWDDEIVGC